MKTHYDTLGVPPDASSDAIRAAFRQLVKRYHPDGPQGNLQIYQQITEAYAVLGSPTARVDYDRHLAYLRGEDPDADGGSASSGGAPRRAKRPERPAPAPESAERSGRRGRELLVAAVALAVALGAVLILRYFGDRPSEGSGAPAPSAVESPADED